MNTILRCRKCGGEIIVETNAKKTKDGKDGKRVEKSLVCLKCKKKY